MLVRPLFVYWLAWILAAIAFWLTVGWFGLGALIVDPVYDWKVNTLVSSISPNRPSKTEMEVIERERSSMFKALGVLGGVLSGFAFGASAQRLRSVPAKTEEREDRGRGTDDA